MEIWSDEIRRSGKEREAALERQRRIAIATEPFQLEEVQRLELSNWWLRTQIEMRNTPSSLAKATGA
jgi:hypothetical protein